MQHEASIYRDARAHVLATINSHGWAAAEAILKNKKAILTGNGWVGLKAEFDFFRLKNKDFGLIGTLDYGDHTDFVGTIAGKQVCFDVTTSLRVKQLRDYEPFQAKGRSYKIALMDHKSGQLLDLVDINFRPCPDCGGKMVDVIIALDDTTKGGSPSPYQIVAEMCLDDPEHCATLDMLHIFEPPADTFETTADFLRSKRDLMKFIQKETGRYPTICGVQQYEKTDNDGGGYYTVKPVYHHPILNGLGVESEYSSLNDLIDL